MVHFSRIAALSAAIFFSLNAFCCTSVIISGNVRTDGRPVMLKHRDTGELNNRIQWFSGPSYYFIGLVNSSSSGGEVWSGTNSAGFSIMNTATYDLKDDDVPDSMMDKEGVLMYKALGICSTLKDFETLLDTLPRPLGVEANFGIINALGEAAYYEVNNHSWKRYDVADQPGGYMVVTNFTRSGRPEDRHGVDRFEKASSIMSSLDVSVAGHAELFNSISRSGDPIMRKSSAASIVFEGVKEGGDPLGTVMWTILGCPTNCIYLPLRVFDSDHVPSFMKNNAGKDNSQICDNALIIKGIYGYLQGCQEECKYLEKTVDSKFDENMHGVRYDMYMKKMYSKYLKLCSRKMPKVAY